MAQAFNTETQRADQVFGAPAGAIFGKCAIGEPPPGSTGLNLPLMLRAIAKVLGWRLSGKAWPNPFFRPNTREPTFPLIVISPERREALRPKMRSAPDEGVVPGLTRDP